MLVIEFGIVTEVRLVQFAKVDSLILVIEFGIFIEVRPVLVKAPRPMYVTELGIVIELKALQRQKTKSPMHVTELGIVAEVIAVSPIKAYCLMVSTLFGITKLVTNESFKYKLWE